MGLKFLEQDERVRYIGDAAEYYRSIGLATQLDHYRKKGKRPAILVIDIQNMFTSPDSPLGAKGVDDEILKIINDQVLNSRRVVDAAREKQIPILYSRTEYRKDGLDGGSFIERLSSVAPLALELLTEGSKMAEIDERIKPEEGDFVLVKKAPSFFVGTPLLDILTYLKVDVNIILGNSASGCVRATVTDSISHGFYPVVPEECIADRAIGPYKANMFDMMAKYADVVSTAEVLEWIDTLPEFTST